MSDRAKKPSYIDFLAQRAAAAESLVASVCQVARVIGIGEHAHGDEVSWGWRVDIARALVRRGHRLVIACENMDCFVKGLRRRPGPVFETHKAKFFPYMMPYSDRSQVQMDAAKELTSLAEGRVYGIEAQAVRFPAVLKCGGKLVADAIGKVGAVRRWRTANDGKLRNRLNAEIVAEIARRHPRHTVLYLAHNEHVALSCEAHRREPAYVTDGAILRSNFGARYVAIATFSPSMWCFWGGPLRQIRDGTLRPPRGRRAAIVVGDEPMGDDYKVSDFDYVVVEAPSRVKPEIRRRTQGASRATVPSGRVAGRAR